MESDERDIFAVITERIGKNGSDPKRVHEMREVATALQAALQDTSSDLLPEKVGAENLLRAVMHVLDGRDDPQYLREKLHLGVREMLRVADEHNAVRHMMQHSGCGLGERAHMRVSP